MRYAVKLLIHGYGVWDYLHACPVSGVETLCTEYMAQKWADKLNREDLANCARLCECGHRHGDHHPYPGNGPCHIPVMVGDHDNKRREQCACEKFVEDWRTVAVKS